jgi:hypothetical protein
LIDKSQEGRFEKIDNKRDLNARKNFRDKHFHAVDGIANNDQDLYLDVSDEDWKKYVNEG